MTLPRTVADVLADHVLFELECIDRMYCNVYVPQLQHAGGLLGYVQRQLGLPIASTAPLGKITDAFAAAMRRFARDQHIPWVDFAKGQRKDDVMHAYLARFTGQEGVLFIGLQAYELALDVASFANASGGLIGIGLETLRDENGFDVVSAVRGLRKAVNSDRYGQILTNRIVPPVDGLQIIPLVLDDKQILVLYIPAQSTETKPRIVRGGTISTGKVAGSMFSILREDPIAKRTCLQKQCIHCLSLRDWRSRPRLSSRRTPETGVLCQRTRP